MSSLGEVLNVSGLALVSAFSLGTAFEIIIIARSIIIIKCLIEICRNANSIHKVPSSFSQ